MVIDMKAKNKGRPQSFGGGGTPNKNKGNFQPKKSFSPNNKQGGGPPRGPQGARPGKQFGNKNNSPGKKGEGKPQPQQTPNKQPNQQKAVIAAKLQSPVVKAEQNGNNKRGDALRQFNDKSKPGFKASKGKQGRNENQKGPKKNKSTNRYHRFQNKLSKKVRTPQSCARALKGEQELSASHNRILKITLPDQVISTQDVHGWTAGIESVLFTKSLEPRHFTVVLSADANLKKEMEKLSKVTVNGGKITVKENDPSELGHTQGTNKDPAEMIDPYTLYVTNLPEGMNKSELEALFPGALVSAPKKHNPKMGTPSKFAFVSFDTPETALTAFQENFNKAIEGKSIVMRFRRLNMFELKKEQHKKKNEGAVEENQAKAKKEATNAKAKDIAKAGKVATQVKAQGPQTQNKVQQQLKGNKPVKQEPIDDDHDEDDDDDEEDDEMEMDDEEDESGDDAQEMDDDDDDDDDEEDDDDEDDDDDDDDDDDE